MKHIVAEIDDLKIGGAVTECADLPFSSPKEALVVPGMELAKPDGVAQIVIGKRGQNTLCAISAVSKELGIEASQLSSIERPVPTLRYLIPLRQ